MSETEHLLLKLMEECNEVAQRASKAIQFTLSEMEPGSLRTNSERLVGEFIDLIAVWELLEADGAVVMPASDAFRQAIRDKQEKVKRYRAYSLELQTKGVATPPEA